MYHHIICHKLKDILKSLYKFTMLLFNFLNREFIFTSLNLECTEEPLELTLVLWNEKDTKSFPHQKINYQKLNQLNTFFMQRWKLFQLKFFKQTWLSDAFLYLVYYARYDPETMLDIYKKKLHTKGRGKWSKTFNWRRYIRLYFFSRSPTTRIWRMYFNDS